MSNNTVENTEVDKNKKVDNTKDIKGKNLHLSTY